MPKTERIRTLFDDIAPSYDKLNHILSLNVDKTWRRKAVRRTIDTDSPLRILDVACGTGDMCIALAKRLRRAEGNRVTGIDLSERLRRAEGSRVTGIDLSENMLTICREKLIAEGLEKAVELRQGNCEDLPFGDGGFERVTVAFGVRNFEHIDLGLKEMYRVLAPGGKLLVLELSIPSNTFVAKLYKLYFLKILPLIGRLVSGDRGAYEYLPASVLKFPAPDRFCGMMRSAGFADVSHKALTFGICRMFIGRKE